MNLGYTRLGIADSGVSRSLYGWAVAASHELTEVVGAAAEFSGVMRTGVNNTAQFLAALTYNVSPRLVLDAGAAWGLHKASADWMAFAGMT